MTLNEFKNWALGEGSVAKYNDDQFKGECVSLVNQYCYRVLDIPAGAWGHAKDWATNPSALTHFDAVSDLRAGDVLVYPATNTNPYGHIEIALGDGLALNQNRHLDGRVRVESLLNGYGTILRSKKAGEEMASPDMIRLIIQHLLYRPATDADLEAYKGWTLEAVFRDVSATPERNDRIVERERALKGGTVNAAANALKEALKNFLR